MATLLENFLVGVGIRPDVGSFNNIRSQFANLTRVVGGAALVIKGAQVLFTGAILGMANSLDSLSDSAGKIGVTVTELDKLGYVASQTDSTLEAATASLQGVARAAGNAEFGMKRSIDVFKKLGVQWKNSNGEIKDSATLLYEVGAAMKGLSKADQLALGSKLGIDQTMINTITGDMGTLIAEYELFAKVSGVSLEEAAQASSDLMDEMGKMKTFSTMLMRSIMSEFIVKMKNGLRDLRQWAVDNADRIKKVVQTILAILTKAGDTISSLFARVGVIMRKVMDWWDELSDSSKNAIGAIVGLTTAFYLLNKTMLLNPVGILIASLAALFALYDDFKTFTEGGDSLIDWGPYVDQIEAVLETVQKLWDGMIAFIGWIYANTDFSFILDSAKRVFGGLLDTISGAVDAIKALFNFDGQGFVDGFSSAIDGIEGILTGLKDFIIGQLGAIRNIILYAFDIDIQPFIDAMKSSLEILIRFVTDAARSIGQVFGGAVDIIRGLFTGDMSAIFDGLGNIVRGAINAIEAIFIGFLDVVSFLVVGVGNYFGVDLTGIFDSFKSVVGAVFGAIDGFISGTIDTIKSLVGWAGKAVDAVKQFFGAKNKAENTEIKLPSGQSVGASDKTGRGGLNIASTGSDLDKTPMVSQGAKSGTINNTTTNEQKNEFNIKNDFNITGTGDPEATGRQVAMRQNDVARNMTSVVAPMPARK